MNTRRVVVITFLVVLIILALVMLPLTRYLLVMRYLGVKERLEAPPFTRLIIQQLATLPPNSVSGFVEVRGTVKGIDPYNSILQTHPSPYDASAIEIADG